MKKTIMTLCLALALPSLAAADGDDEFKVYWKNGVRFDSADKNFRLKLGGRIQLDSSFYDLDSDLKDVVGDQSDGVEFRRARLYLSGEIYSNVIFKAQYDFAGQDADFNDVYVGLKSVPWLGTVRVGHMKEPFGLEVLTSSKYNPNVERSLASEAFGPSRNTGIAFANAFLEERMTLAAGVFRPTGDSGDSAFDANGEDEYAITARVTGLPVDNDTALVHLGFALSYRDLNEARFRSRPEAHAADRFVDTQASWSVMEGGETVKESADIATDDLMLYGVEAAAVIGSASVQAEFMAADVSLSGPQMRASGPVSSDDPLFTGWYVLGSYWLTGEQRNYKRSDGVFDRVTPNRNFDGKGGWGAFEATLRWSSLDLSDELFEGGEIDGLTVGLNWHLNPNTRVMANYGRTDLDGAGTGNIFITRFQVDF